MKNFFFVFLSIFLLVSFAVSAKSLEQKFYETTEDCTKEGVWATSHAGEDHQLLTEANYAKVAGGISVSLENFACSGDWTLSEKYDFDLAGRVQSYSSQLSTTQSSHENGITIKVANAYDKNSNVFSTTTKITDAKTGEELKNLEPGSYHQVEPSRYYKNVSELPFRHLLK